MNFSAERQKSTVNDTRILTIVRSNYSHEGIGYFLHF